MNLPPGCEARCPACAHRGWEAGKSIQAKLDFLKQTLNPWSELIAPVRTVAGEKRWGYREKASLRAKWDDQSGRWRFGLLIGGGYKQDPEFVAIPNCPVHSLRVREVVQVLSERLPGPSELPLVFLVVTGALVTLVLKSKPKGLNPVLLEKELEISLKRIGIAGLWVNFNPSAGQRVFSSRAWQKVWGEGIVRDRQRIYGPQTFQQLIPELYEDALNEAKSFLKPGSSDTVVDLYSGSGASLELWEEAGARFLGVELVGEAVRCAEMRIGEGKCLRGRASDRIPQIEQWRKSSLGERLLVFANPPRLGLEPEVVTWISSQGRPARLAYLSCSPGTLARDLSGLTQSGYAVQGIIPYDFFPQTHHIETLVLLELDSARRFPGSVDSRLASRSVG